jgi:hypothetical protein
VIIEPGTHGVSDTLAMIRAVVDNPRFVPGCGAFVDARPATQVPSQGDVAVLANAISSPGLLQSHPVALVAGSAAQYGIASMLATLTVLSGGLARGFPTADEARAWSAAGTPVERPGPGA